MIKTNIVLLASFMMSTTLIAEDNGVLDGYLRLHHIFDGETNGFDKNSGSTIGIGLKYGQTFSKYFALGGEFYTVTETAHNEGQSIAFGQGLGDSTSDNAAGSVMGLHFRLKDLPGKSKISWAKSQFKSPLTKIEITHVPNMYEYVRADTGVFGGNLSLSFISSMAYGSRSAADWGLIGEFTGTAGMVITPFSNKVAVHSSGVSLERGKYNTIGDTTGGLVDSSGITVLGYEKKIDNLKLNIWDFKVDNILNNLYLEADYKMTLGEGMDLVLSGQYLSQDMDTDVLNVNGNTYGGVFYGAQAMLKYKNIVLKAGYSKKDNEGGLYNAWGANPGYTSSIFSRNEYRDGVSAYKGTAIYNFAKNLKIMVSHANYGQSEMKYKSQASVSDAKETDIAIIYKPRKDVMLKLFNANRTSEFDGVILSGVVQDRTQNHTRLIVNYEF